MKPKCQCGRVAVIIDFAMDRTQCVGTVEEHIDNTYHWGQTKDPVNEKIPHTNCKAHETYFWCRKCWGSWEIQDNPPFYEKVSTWRKTQPQ